MRQREGHCNWSRAKIRANLVKEAEEDKSPEEVDQIEREEARGGGRRRRGGPVQCAPIADDLLALCNLRRMVRFVEQHLSARNVPQYSQTVHGTYFLFWCSSAPGSRKPVAIC